MKQATLENKNYSDDELFEDEDHENQSFLPSHSQPSSPTSTKESRSKRKWLYILIFTIIIHSLISYYFDFNHAYGNSSGSSSELSTSGYALFSNLTDANVELQTQLYQEREKSKEKLESTIEEIKMETTEKINSLQDELVHERDWNDEQKQILFKIQSKANESHHVKKSNIVFGHLHFPKTGGTNLNGLMASKYDNVCGNKGYSYDAYQFNKRGKQNKITTPGCNHDVITMALKEMKTKKGKCQHNGVVDENYPKRDRGRVNDIVMNEIGYENCDYISNERKWTFWFDLIENMQFAQRNLTLELHVPCREPIDHLMSIANYGGHEFRCHELENNEELKKSVNVVYAQNFEKRISNELNQTSHLQLKCFNAFPIKSYIEHMGQHLQPRRIPVDEYWPRDTNKPRNKAKECIWSQTDEYKQKVLEILLSQSPYFKFCHNCMGSKNELQLS